MTSTGADSPDVDENHEEHSDAPGIGGVRRWVLWLAGLAVALGAAAATAHGLYEVAVASRVPEPIAWLYPLITDGLALVAYGATARLSGSAARYAWAVVVLAAGLSGLAQAAFLAGDEEVLVAPSWLRFGVGAWPAVAAAVVAHLLYLLAESPSVDRPLSMPDPEPDRSEEREPTVDEPELMGGGAAPEWAALRSAPVAVQRTYTPAVQARVYSDPFTPPAIEAADPSPAVGGGRVAEEAEGERSAEEERSDREPDGGTEHQPVAVAGAVAPVRERAEAAARRHVDDHGALPTVSELQALAGVSRGTAAAALKALRERPELGPTNPAAPFIEITQP